MAQVQGIYGVGNVGGSKKTSANSNPLLNMGNSGWKPGSIDTKKPNDFAPTIPGPSISSGKQSGSSGYSGGSSNYSGGASSSSS